jgi:hypothetical protein
MTNARFHHFFFRRLGLRTGGISDFGTCTSFRARSRNALIPLGFLAITILSLQPHESAAIDLRQLAVGQAASDHVPHHVGEPLAVVGLPVVEPADLLIDVSLKVEGRDRNVSPFEGTFQQRSRSFPCCWCGLAPHVLARVVDDLVDVVLPKLVIRLVRVGADERPLRDVLPARISGEVPWLRSIQPPSPDFPAPLDHPVDDALTDRARGP